jgi:hypothetical protein
MQHLTDMEAKKLEELKLFVAALQAKPELLHTPQLAFFKTSETKIITIKEK